MKCSRPSLRSEIMSIVCGWQIWSTFFNIQPLLLYLFFLASVTTFLWFTLLYFLSSIMFTSCLFGWIVSVFLTFYLCLIVLQVLIDDSLLQMLQNRPQVVVLIFRQNGLGGAYSLRNMYCRSCLNLMLLMHRVLLNQQRNIPSLKIFEIDVLLKNFSGEIVNLHTTFYFQVRLNSHRIGGKRWSLPWIWSPRAGSLHLVIIMDRSTLSCWEILELSLFSLFWHSSAMTCMRNVVKFGIRILLTWLQCILK